MRPLLLSLLLLAMATTTQAAASPRVVVSIAPIHALVASVTDGVLEPELLMKPGTTPHSYALRPSDARMLADADLVIWVGEALESMLRKPLAGLAADARQFELLELDRLTCLPAREGGVWKSPEHPGHAQAHRDCDPHLWLAPENARVIVDAVAAALVSMDPERAAAYRANAERTQQRIDALTLDLEQRLALVRSEPYLVFHDAYQYFETAFGLHPLGAVAIDPDRPPGARRLAAIRANVRAQGALCVFSEPQFRSDLVDVVVEGTGARQGVLDPVGGDLEAGPDLWFELMENLGAALTACLQPDFSPQRTRRVQGG